MTVYLFANDFLHLARETFRITGKNNQALNNITSVVSYHSEWEPQSDVTLS